MNKPKKGTDEAITWGKPVGGLRLGLAAEDGELELRLHNAGSEPLQVLSHVNAGEKHLDWYVLYVARGKGDPREIVLMDDRERSSVVRAHLGPGEDLSHRVDVAAWAARPANGGQPLAPGEYHVTATYEVDRGNNNWCGKLEAGPVTMSI